MVGKMLLPFLGGNPSVWTTSMVFFQAILLLGYGYAHAATRKLVARRQILVHMLLFLLALFFLPIRVQTTSLESPSLSPIFWLIQTLTIMVGLPYFMLSSGSPLLQIWYASTGDNQPEGALSPTAGDEPCEFTSRGEGGRACPRGLVASMAMPTLIEKIQIHDLSAHQKNAPHEATFLKLDCAKAMNVLHWMPAWSVSQTISETISWYHDYYNDPNFSAMNATIAQIKAYSLIQGGL